MVDAKNIKRQLDSFKKKGKKIYKSFKIATMTGAPVSENFDLEVSFRENQTRFLQVACRPVIVVGSGSLWGKAVQLVSMVLIVCDLYAETLCEHVKCMSSFLSCSLEIATLIW